MLAVRNVSKYSPPLFDAPEGALHDWQILLELAARLNANTPADKLVWKGIKKVVEKLKPEGILDILLQTGPYGHLPLGLTLSRCPTISQSVDCIAEYEKIRS